MSDLLLLRLLGLGLGHSWLSILNGLLLRLLHWLDNVRLIDYWLGELGVELLVVLVIVHICLGS